MLLAAWNSGDLARLLDVVDRVSQGAASSSLRHSDELERMETIAGVTEQMQAWLRNGGEGDPAQMRASVKLLRHLAGADQPAYTPKAGLQLEMRASCRR